MINTDNHRVLYRIWRAVDNYLMRDIKPPETPAAVPLPAELQRSLPGYYANIGPRDSDYLGLLEYYASLRSITADAHGMAWHGMAWKMPLGRSAQRWVAVSEKLFRLEKETKPGLALVRSENGETLLQGNTKTYARISAARVWFALGGFAASVLVMMGAFPFAMIWALRKVLGRLPNPGPWSVRVFPLLGAAAFCGFFFLYVGAQGGGVATEATPNCWTIGMMQTSLLIPLAAILSGIAVWRHRRAAMNRGAYWHSVFVALGVVFMAGCFISWGMVGLRMWV